MWTSTKYDIISSKQKDYYLKKRFSEKKWSMKNVNGEKKMAQNLSRWKSILAHRKHLRYAKIYCVYGSMLNVTRTDNELTNVTEPLVT